MYFYIYYIYTYRGTVVLSFFRNSSFRWFPIDFSMLFDLNCILSKCLTRSRNERVISDEYTPRAHESSSNEVSDFLENMFVNHILLFFAVSMLTVLLKKPWDQCYLYIYIIFYFYIYIIYATQWDLYILYFYIYIIYTRTVVLSYCPFSESKFPLISHLFWHAVRPQLYSFYMFSGIPQRTRDFWWIHTACTRELVNWGFRLPGKHVC